MAKKHTCPGGRWSGFDDNDERRSKEDFRGPKPTMHAMCLRVSFPPLPAHSSPSICKHPALTAARGSLAFGAGGIGG